MPAINSSLPPQDNYTVLQFPRRVNRQNPVAALKCSRVRRFTPYQ
jgi:hypothetical protein